MTQRCCGNIKPFQRLNYFTGQVLSAQDFQDEQTYLIEKFRALNKYLHGWGVVCGLNVSLQQDEVVVEQGVALDCIGNVIIVPEKQCSRLPETETTHYVVLEYEEMPAGNVPVPGLPSTEELTEPSRIAEGYSIRFSEENPCKDHNQAACEELHAIPLAKLTHSGGSWHVRMCQYTTRKQPRTCQSFQDDDNRTSFEKSRLHYCTELFSSEIARMERLNKKAQFYLTFVAAVLGAIFFENEFLTNLLNQAAAVEGSKAVAIMIYLSLLVLLVFVVSSLFSIFKSISVRTSGRGYPNNLHKSLFSKESNYFKQGDEEDFLRSTAITYASAAESYGKNNLEKAKWLRFASYSVLGVLACLTILLLNIII